MNTTTIRGADGVILWGYHRAASLGPWTLASANGTGLTLIATVTQADTFRVTQAPLTFRVARQNGSAWIWPILSLHIADGTLTATLDPQE